MTIVPTINKLRTVAHSHGVPVIYLRMGFAADYSDSGICLEQLPAAKYLEGFIRGTWDTEIVDELTPDESKHGVLEDWTPGEVGRAEQ
jgi:ureidoacrylate peracid hydrolase